MNPSFTVEQVGAGRPVFQTNCATCHGADLSGGPYTPPLAGRVFVDAWSKRSIRDLIESIRTMPPNNPRISTTTHGSMLPRTFCRRMASRLARVRTLTATRSRRSQPADRRLLLQLLP